MKRFFLAPGASRTQDPDLSAGACPSYLLYPGLRFQFPRNSRAMAKNSPHVVFPRRIFRGISVPWS